jgi:hypothetical protein
MWGWRHPVLWSLVLCGLGCAPAPPPPKAPPPPPPDAARLSRQLEASLAALALPDDLLIAGRWKNPSALLGQVSAWSGGTLALESWLKNRLGDPSRPIDLTAPIELIVVLDQERDPPAPSWAISLGLGPAGSASKNGAEPLDVESPLGLSCAESKALGAASARMVCSPTDDSLARLLPHATRALPLAPVGDADISISLRAQPLAGLESSRLRALSGSLVAKLVEVSHINDRFDGQWALLIDAVAAELAFLAQDLDGASIELSLGASEQALELSVLAPAARGRSTLGQLLVGSGATGLAPSDFWQVHESSEEAGFLWAFQAGPIARLREPLAALLGTLLDYRGVPNRLEQQARELVMYLPMPRGPVVHASGRLPSAASARQQRTPWLEALGWQLYSLRGNFDEYRYYAGALAKSFDDEVLGPQLRRLFKSGFGAKWAPARLTQRRPNGPVGLPRGSFVLEVDFVIPPSELIHDAPSWAPEEDADARPRAPAIAPAPPPAPEWYAVFVPDEDGVRIACGADERFLVSLLAQPSSAKASGTLAGRAGLGSLNQHRILAGGFFSLAGLEEMGPGLRGWLGAQGRLEENANATYAGISPALAAPHHGATPIVYSLSQPSEAWLHLMTRLERGTLEDLSFLLGGSPPERSAAPALGVASDGAPTRGRAAEP